jgi:hypothetical protein
MDSWQIFRLLEAGKIDELRSWVIHDLLVCSSSFYGWVNHPERIRITEMQEEDGTVTAKAIYRDEVEVVSLDLKEPKEEDMGDE